MERDPWIALDQTVGATSEGANVVRIALKRPLDTPESASLARDVAEAADHFVHLMDEIADVVAKRNARSETLARRAVSALQRAEGRIRELEIQLASAEARAVRADQAIARLDTSVREKFGLLTPPPSAA